MKASHLKRAELTSSIGAAILGGGVALLYAEALSHFALAILLIGIFVHTWGMYDKRRLERQSDAPRIWWAEFLYWTCWVGIIGLALYIFVTLEWT